MKMPQKKETTNIYLPGLLHHIYIYKGFDKISFAKRERI